MIDAIPVSPKEACFEVNECHRQLSGEDFFKEGAATIVDEFPGVEQVAGRKDYGNFCDWEDYLKKMLDNERRSPYYMQAF